MPSVYSVDLGVIPGIELTPSKRNKLVGASLFGATPTQISRATKIPLSTVKDTLRLDPVRHKGHSQKRSGRPKEWDRAFERSLLRFVRRCPKATYKKIKDELHHTLSDRTIYQILKDRGILNWRAKKRPLLLREHAKARQQWCSARRQYEEAMWATFIFSDECSLERGSGRRRIWVFRTLE